MKKREILYKVSGLMVYYYYIMTIKPEILYKVSGLMVII